MTCERTSTPSALRNAFASAPPATRAAVSRALARSRMLRTSPVRYFHVPTRSAWPGRGRCTSGTSASTGHGFIRSSQLAKSLLGIWSATGPPSVRPWRTPAVTSALSLSIFIRPPRPWPSWRRAMSPLIASRSSSRPAGSPSTMQVRPGPCDSPAVMRRSAIRPYRLRARTLARGVTARAGTAENGLPTAARHAARGTARCAARRVPARSGTGCARVARRRPCCWRTPAGDGPTAASPLSRRLRRRARRRTSRSFSSP